MKLTLIALALLLTGCCDNRDQAWDAVLRSRMQRGPEEPARYADADRECWRDALDGVPPASARGVTCIGDGTISDPCGAGSLLWGRTR